MKGRTKKEFDTEDKEIEKRYSKSLTKEEKKSEAIFRIRRLWPSICEGLKLIKLEKKAKRKYIYIYSFFFNPYTKVDFIFHLFKFSSFSETLKKYEEYLPL